MKSFLIGGILLAFTAGVAAHHSIAAIYDRTAQVTLDGVVAEFRLVNPHAFLTMQVTRNNRNELWKLELDNRWELVDIGVTPNTLSRGDRIVAKGSAARDDRTRCTRCASTGRPTASGTSRSVAVRR